MRQIKNREPQDKKGREGKVKRVSGQAGAIAERHRNKMRKKKEYEEGGEKL